MYKIIIILFLSFKMTLVMAQKEINTSVQIEAPPAIVWEVLTRFSDYPIWNPFITKAEGDFTKGNKVSIVAGGMKFKPLVLVNNENVELRWKGKLLVKGLFDGEHIFKLIENSDGSTTFKQEEIFTGILVSLFKKKLDTETLSGFQDMNQKLKELSEEAYQGTSHKQL